jgi:hypothetical protein
VPVFTIRHDLGRMAVDHVVDADPFVGLVREVEDAGAIGDAVVQIADAAMCFWS